jgi:NAD(P)-dependent dehydrogenase (short-subunit alcohol dehydrogenase family)
VGEVMVTGATGGIGRAVVTALVGAGHQVIAVGGRWDVRERGELQWLESGELRRYDLEIGALNGEASIGQFEARVSWLATTGSERSES